MTHTGNLGVVDKVWVNEGGVATIIPLMALAKIWRVTYDSTLNDGKFVVWTDKGKIVLDNNDGGMPYIDLTTLEGEVALSLVQTVRGNAEGYTKREVNEAREARKAQAMVGHPTDREWLGMVRANIIKNCPITDKAVINAQRIFGPELAGVRGRTIRETPASVTTDYVQIPREILERHRRVVLAVDVMFVNGVPFLVSVARGLNFITVEHTKTRTAKNLAECVRHIIDMYSRGGFQVGTVLMDNEFESLRNLIPILSINTTAAKEHVPEIERRIRTIKERGRAILNTLPFKKLPLIVLIELIHHVVMWLNAFPSKSGVSSTLSPREIVLKHKLDFKIHCRAQFGEYCEAHDEPSITNSMTPRTSPAIVLGPTGNLQGTYKLFSLNTFKKIKRRKFTVMPMPDSVIKKIERYANNNTARGNLDFADRNGVLFEWNDDVDENPEHIVEHEQEPYPSIESEFPGIDLQRDDIQAVEADDEPPQGQLENAALENADIERNNYNADDIDLIEPVVDVGVVPVGVVPVVEVEAFPAIIKNENDEEEDDNDSIADDDDNSYANTLRPQTQTSLNIPPATNEESGEEELDDFETVEDDGDQGVGNSGVRRSSRSNKGTTSKYNDYTLYMHMKQAARGGPRRAKIKDGVMFFSAQDMIDAKPMTEEDRDEFALGVALNTYGLRAGMKKFGERGEKSVRKELTQMHDLNVYVPVEADSLTEEQKAKAVKSLLMIKEKRGPEKEVKARLLGDGRDQRGQFTKQETTSPTVAKESVFITSVIAAYEKRKTGTYDIPGAYLNANCDANDEPIVMVLKGRLAEMMVQVNPSLYRKYIAVDGNGTPVLYVRMEKAMYGLLKSALLFYRRLVGDLLENGFVLNPYDPCVANKMINGKQMTVIWHVDDLKVTHVDQKEVVGFGEWLSEKYGKKVTGHCGKVHDYLGMIFDYTQDGKVLVNQIEYIKSIIEDFPEEIKRTRTTPAADYLFTVRDESEAKKLPEEQAVYFHHAVAQLNYLATGARRDIHPCVAFLTTRVRNPDEDDWGKLRRLLEYLKGTLHMPLILSADSLALCRWWVDASFAVHEDMKGHTGAGMSFGQGMVLGYSWKHKNTAKSSTESEIYGVDDTLGHILWTRYFMQEQGYVMEPSLIYQDNMSAILLENNGKLSSSKRTRHIKIKYYHMKEKKDDGEISFEHCPTEQMWADINTKPKQGAAFREFRGHVMGIPVDYNDDDYKDTVPSMVSKSMLPMTKAQLKAQVASKECVVGVTVGSSLKSKVPDKNRKVSWSGDITESIRSPAQTCLFMSDREPLRMVKGRKWCMNTYRSCRLRGDTLERAWRRAFVK
jgi:hypothetical protein